MAFSRIHARLRNILILPRNRQIWFIRHSAAVVFNGLMRNGGFEMKTILLAAPDRWTDRLFRGCDADRPLKAPSDVTRTDYACGRGWHSMIGENAGLNQRRYHRRPPPYWGDRPPPRYGWGWTDHAASVANGASTRDRPICQSPRRPSTRA